MPTLEITDSAFDFSGKGYEDLTSIDSLTITLTVKSGETADGLRDDGEWTLGLDGVNTGLLLDDFPGGWDAVARTYSQIPVATQDAILAQLADGMLVATIIDSNYGDKYVALCEETHYATLTLEGDEAQLPEPSTIVIWSLLGGCAAALAWRRRGPRA